MDLNYLLGRHQQALHRAGTAASSEARLSHRGLAAGYANQIRALRTMLGATAQLGGAL